LHVLFALFDIDAFLSVVEPKPFIPVPEPNPDPASTDFQIIFLNTKSFLFNVRSCSIVA
jgi:hypothetical protein